MTCVINAGSGVAWGVGLGAPPRNGERGEGAGTLQVLFLRQLLSSTTETKGNSTPESWPPLWGHGGR